MLMLLFVATSSNMELAAGWPSYDLGQDVGRGGIRFRESKKSGRGGGGGGVDMGLVLGDEFIMETQLQVLVEDGV